jgi:uncharacterized protein YggE
MKLVRLAAAVAVFGLVVALAGVGRPDGAHGTTAPTQSTHAITVGGIGSVRAVPNRAQFSFGVTTQGTTAAQAIDANTGLARKVIAALKAGGVASDDLQTEAVSLEPRYSDDDGAIVGYTATNSVSATSRDLAKAGALVDAAVAAGANQASGPSLTRSDQAELYRNALRAAVADARAKADAIAAAGGLQLGEIRSVVEGSSAPPPEPLARDAAGEAAATPVEPGTQTIEATVTVEFALL